MASEPLAEDLWNLYYKCYSFLHSLRRCREPDAWPSEVNSLREDLEGLLEMAERFSGLDKMLQLAERMDRLPGRATAKSMREAVWEAKRILEEKEKVFKSLGIDPENGDHEWIWEKAASEALYSRRLWKGRMSLERLREMIAAREEGFFGGGEDPELMWRIISFLKEYMLEKVAKEVYGELKGQIKTFYELFLEEYREMILESYEDYKWALEELGRPVKPLESIVAEVCGAGLAGLLDEEAGEDRKLLDKFTGNLNRLKDELGFMESYRSIQETRERRKHLILAHYHARRVEELLDRVRELTSKYPGLSKMVRETEELLRRVKEEGEVEEEDLEWVRMQEEGEQSDLDMFLEVRE